MVTFNPIFIAAADADMDKVIGKVVGLISDVSLKIFKL